MDPGNAVEIPLYLIVLCDAGAYNQRFNQPQRNTTPVVSQPQQVTKKRRCKWIDYSQLKCEKCGTLEWRKGRSGNRLCNACVLRYQRHLRLEQEQIQEKMNIQNLLNK